MKKPLLLAAIALTHMASWAAPFNTLNVHLVDGSTVDIILTDELSLKFDETNLVVTGIDADVSMPKDKVVKFTHSLSESGIDIPGPDNGMMRIDGDCIYFSNLPDRSFIDVHSLNGVRVFSERAGGNHVLKLDDFVTGVYIVSVNGVSYKISVK